MFNCQFVFSVDHQFSFVSRSTIPLCEWSDLRRRVHQAFSMEPLGSRSEDQPLWSTGPVDIQADHPWVEFFTFTMRHTGLSSILKWKESSLIFAMKFCGSFFFGNLWLQWSEDASFSKRCFSILEFIYWSHRAFENSSFHPSNATVEQKHRKNCLFTSVCSLPSRRKYDDFVVFLVFAHFWQTGQPWQKEITQKAQLAGQVYHQLDASWSWFCCFLSHCTSSVQYFFCRK